MEGWKLAGNVFVRGEDRQLPLYEAKMIHHFDHRFGDYALLDPRARGHVLPEVPAERLGDPSYAPLAHYWVANAEVEARLAGRWRSDWLIGWRNVTDSRASARTVIFSLLPRVGVGHSMPLILSGSADAVRTASLLANLTALPLDFAARQKVAGLNLTYGYLNQFPVLSPSAHEITPPWAAQGALFDWLLPRVLELTYTAWDL